MKTAIIILYLLCFAFGKSYGQATSKSNDVIEGGKLVVELIKAISNKKDQERSAGCKNAYADLCIANQTTSSISVTLLHRTQIENGETREVVVLPDGKECFLQVSAGIWTYDLKVPGTNATIRKGDVRIEGCNDLVMTIR